MRTRTQVHDAIVGAILLVTLVLAKTGSHHWLYVTGAIALLMVSSVVTGFCPVYFLMNKLAPEKTG